MEAAGKRNTIEYENARNELVNINGCNGRRNSEANILALRSKGMQGIISGLTGITGLFQPPKVQSDYLPEKMKTFKKIMLKVQSLMAITIGLQQIEQMLNKDSAFTLVVVS